MIKPRTILEVPAQQERACLAKAQVLIPRIAKKYFYKKVKHREKVSDFSPDPCRPFFVSLPPASLGVPGIGSDRVGALGSVGLSGPPPGMAWNMETSLMVIRDLVRVKER